MKRWLIVLAGLTLAVVVTTGAAFAFAGDGSDNPEQVAADQDDEPSGDQPTATSIDDIDPDVCNWIHNITACDGDPEDPYPMPVGPFPMPVLEGPGALDLTSDEEIQCGPDEAVSIAPDGQVSCLTAYQTEDDKDTSDRLGMPPAIEPTPVD